MELAHFKVSEDERTVLRCWTAVMADVNRGDEKGEWRGRTELAIVLAFSSMESACLGSFFTLTSERWNLSPRLALIIMGS